MQLLQPLVHDASNLLLFPHHIAVFLNYMSTRGALFE
jgi:hypothetical protein